MSDADKPTPESPPSGTSEASGGTGANVISIEQARADAERLADDPDDQAEILAIQRYMGTAE